jgi:hypothetical protein
VLLGRAEVVQVQRRQVLVRAQAGGDSPRGAAGELLGHYRIGHEVGARATDLGRVLHPEVAELSHSAHDLFRERLLCLPLGGMREQLALDEGPHGAPKLLVLGLEEISR